MKNKLTFLILFCFCACSLMAQELPGKKDSINSDILKEKRTFQVVLPAGYKPESGKKYDVIYVTDGDWNTKPLSQVEQFLEEENRIPACIIVGILNVDRDRDFLPTHNASNKTSGGADKFLAFMKSELIPYINKTYPSNGDNTLFGHSFGGVFVMYALLTEPQVFESYIAADPSFWWDNNAMLKWVPSKLADMKTPGRTLYVTGRLGSGMKDMRIPQIDSILKKDAPATLAWKLMAYPDETHGTVRLKSAYDGLKFSYTGYSGGKIVFHPMDGVILSGKPISLWYFSDTTNVRYTWDGTQPTIASAQLTHDNLLSGPGKVIIKRFASRDRYSETFSGSFESGDYLKPTKLQHKMKPGGFNYAYYEGEWDKLPDFKTMKPVKTGKIDSGFDANKMPRKNHFGLVISGQMEAKEDGYYLFGNDPADGFRLYVDNRLLIDFDPSKAVEGQGKSYIVPLKKGFYPIREEYFKKDGDRKLDVEYIAPSGIATKHSVPIPLDVQYGIVE